MASIAEKIGGYMLANNVGKYEFADKLGIDYRQFVKRLNCEIDWRLSELLKVAAICGCTIDDLVGREGGQ